MIGSTVNSPVLFITLLMMSFRVFSQGSDMVVLKKGPEKTIKTYLTGSQIQFITKARVVVEGRINKILNDSLYINTFHQGKVYNQWGTSFWDTISVGLSKYHIKEIAEIIKPREGFSFIKNGVLFMVGGIGYAFLHSVNAAILKEPISLSTLAITGGVALTGYLLNRIHKNTIRLGNRYYLQYISVK